MRGFLRDRGRRAGRIGCAVAAAIVAVFVLVALMIDPEDAAETVAVDRSLPVPSEAIDTSLWPIANVDLFFADTPVDGDLVTATAVAVKAAAGRIVNAEAERGAIVAANFIVRARVADRPDAPVLHFTIQGDDLRGAVAEDFRPVGFLALTSEAGANFVEGERAARDYCRAAQAIALCEQVLDR